MTPPMLINARHLPTLPLGRRIAFALLSIISLTVHAQHLNQSYLDYINKYNKVAIEQMHEYKIPASITLAQGLFESAAGKSTLATQSHNHFGIKCGMNWTGRTTRHDDDARNECFRVYSTDRESYIDHSKFLQQPRYRRLFTYSITDYKSWAHGLKACGYATNPQYAYRLIGIIEDYQLYKFDTGKHVEYGSGTNFPGDYHEIIYVNDIPCVKANDGDTWESLSKELGVSRRKLISYNESDKHLSPEPGTNIFLKKKLKKGNKATKGYWHKIQPGDSMYSISQQYGIRLKYLYKLNFKDKDYVPEVGDLLRLRD